MKCSKPKVGAKKVNIWNNVCLQVAAYSLQRCYLWFNNNIVGFNKSNSTNEVKEDRCWEVVSKKEVVLN